jgi:hypothetical protein
LEERVQGGLESAGSSSLWEKVAGADEGEAGFKGPGFGRRTGFSGAADGRAGAGSAGKECRQFGEGFVGALPIVAEFLAERRQFTEKGVEIGRLRRGKFVIGILDGFKVPEAFDEVFVEIIPPAGAGDGLQLWGVGVVELIRNIIQLIRETRQIGILFVIVSCLPPIDGVIRFLRRLIAIVPVGGKVRVGWENHAVGTVGAEMRNGTGKGGERGVLPK